MESPLAPPVHFFEEGEAHAHLHEQHEGGPTSRHRLRRGMIHAERRVLVRLRNEGAISDEVPRELEQELDFEAIRVGAGEQR